MRKTLILILLITLSACSLLPRNINLDLTHTNNMLAFNYNEQVSITQLDANNAFTSLNVIGTSDFLIISDTIALSSLDQTMQEQEDNFLQRIGASDDTYFEDMDIGEYTARTLSYRDLDTQAYSRIVFVTIEDNYYFIRYAASTKQSRNLFDAIIETVRFFK